jgi:hypothetical protein
MRPVYRGRTAERESDYNALLCMRGENGITAWVSERKGCQGNFSRLCREANKETF